MTEDPSSLRYAQKTGLRFATQGGVSKIDVGALADYNPEYVVF